MDDAVSMTITDFEKVLTEHPDKTMRFVLPSGKSIPASYHITEVGHVKKDFIDCGGTVRSTSACVLQAWVAANDEDHRLEAGKLAAILKLAAKILPTEDLSVEVEYEAPVISQFSISACESHAKELVFTLATKHTDCLAKESCGLEGASCCSDEEESCCA
jgi:Family of unknown function (DUF6428)